MSESKTNNTTYTSSIVLKIQEESYEIEVEYTAAGEVSRASCVFLGLPTGAQQMIAGSRYKYLAEELELQCQLMSYYVPVAILGYMKSPEWAVFRKCIMKQRTLPPEFDNTLLKSIQNEWVKSAFQEHNIGLNLGLVTIGEFGDTTFNVSYKKPLKPRHSVLIQPVLYLWMKSRMLIYNEILFRQIKRVCFSGQEHYKKMLEVLRDKEQLAFHAIAINALSLYQNPILYKILLAYYHNLPEHCFHKKNPLVNRRKPIGHYRRMNQGGLNLAPGIRHALLNALVKYNNPEVLELIYKRLENPGINDLSTMLTMLKAAGKDEASNVKFLKSKIEYFLSLENEELILNCQNINVYFQNLTLYNKVHHYSDDRLLQFLKKLAMVDLVFSPNYKINILIRTVGLMLVKAKVPETSRKLIGMLEHPELEIKFMVVKVMGVIKDRLLLNSLLGFLEADFSKDNVIKFDLYPGVSDTVRLMLICNAFVAQVVNTIAGITSNGNDPEIIRPLVACGQKYPEILQHVLIALKPNILKNPDMVVLPQIMKWAQIKNNSLSQMYAMELLLAYNNPESNKLVLEFVEHSKNHYAKGLKTRLGIAGLNRLKSGL